VNLRGLVREPWARNRVPDRWTLSYESCTRSLIVQ